MGLLLAHDQVGESYETVPLHLAPDGPPGGRAVLRRRSARPSRRAVVYVLGLGDDFVTDDMVGWYTDRGFHFYAADLREVGRQGRSPYDAMVAAEDLDECFGCLDAAVGHLRDADSITRMVVCGHGSGALIAALWCHARRGSRPADALVLARPRLARPRWAREVPLLAGAQRRLRRGLDITCPVLVMCPASGWEEPGGPGGLLVPRLPGGRRATIRLGEHVTWLRVPEGRRPFFDELGRWLGAYLTAEIRDQLL